MPDERIPDDMQEIIEDFIVESQESLGTLEAVFVDLEKDPGNLELINAVFRPVHSMKGAADFLGFREIVTVAHKSESLLNLLRNEKLVLTPDILDVILAAVDLIKALIQKIDSEEAQQVEIEPTVNRLSALLQSGQSSATPEAPEVTAVSPKASESAQEDRQRAEGPAAEEQTVVAVPSEKPQGGDATPTDTAESRPASATAEPYAANEAVGAEGAGSGTFAEPPEMPETVREQTIRVDVERLDSVMNLVGELVLARNRLFRINHGIESRYGSDELVEELLDTTVHLSVLTTDLQQAVLKTRMQPMRKVFSKLPRVVRDTARKKKKKAALEIIGEETEVDKSIIEEIGSPLVHLLRNAVDHGIEIPDFRVIFGKPETGRVSVSAAYEGDHINIQIEDDGKGMDPEQLREAVVQKGLLEAAEAGRLSEKECLNLIFHPGFSTAEKVTSTSGRGVGMDVVKSNIAKLNGIVAVESQCDRGTQVSIRLPLTVAIIQALMVGVGQETFALPLSAVIETLKLTARDIQTIDEREVITLRDEIVPLVHLARELDVPGAHEGQGGPGYAVIIGLAEKKLGLVVSHLHGQEEIVIKPLGEYLKGASDFAGATLTGDGKVIMILDVGALMRQKSVA